MTDIRAKAEALIKDVEACEGDMCGLTVWDSYEALKAALKPSREEIADYLENHHAKYCSDGSQWQKYCNYAIEELRK